MEEIIDRLIELEFKYPIDTPEKWSQQVTQSSNRTTAHIFTTR